MKTIYFQLFLLLASFRSLLIAQSPGDLDNTFGTAGLVSEDFGNHEFAKSITVQPDGKILVAGYMVSDTDVQFMLSRFEENGLLDLDFGSDGRVFTDFGGIDDEAYSVLLQTDGKIVVTGTTYSGFNSNFALARYHSDGIPDSTFGTEGKVITPFDDPYNSGFSAVLQPDEKIVVAGFSATASNGDFALARYNPDGTLDSTFGTAGEAIINFGFGEDYGLSIALQPDGKIIEAGYTLNGYLLDFALARCNTDGTPDSTFGIDGKVITDFDSSFDHGESVVVQSDGKIVLAGLTSIDAHYDFALARYNPDGTLDDGFGGDGKVTIDYDNSTDRSYAVALQPDGKILVAGETDAEGDLDFALVRLNTNGELDYTFGLDGKVFTDFGSIDCAFAITLQPDGKILTAGYTDNGFTYNLAIARYYATEVETEIQFVPEYHNSLCIYPNPVGQVAVLSYILGAPGVISISLFDSNGKTIKTFIENTFTESGTHTQFITMPSNLSPGNYFIVLNSITERMYLEITVD